MPQVMMPEFIMAHFADMLEGNAKKNARRAAMRRREGIVKKGKSSKGAHEVVRVVAFALPARSLACAVSLSQERSARLRRGW